MRTWIRETGAKLLLVAAVAALAMGALEWWMRQRDAADRTRVEELEADAMAKGIEQVASAVQDRGLSVRSIVLCDHHGAVPEAVVEWQLMADGRLVLRRPPPLPTSPGRIELAAAAIVLPCERLPHLQPFARAVLLDLLSSVWIDRPIAIDRLQLQGITGDPADREALVSWLR
ncbi:MAG: hypothetical protein ABL997_20290 [Planctomycetota bacterium]